MESMRRGHDAAELARARYRQRLHFVRRNPAEFLLQFSSAKELVFTSGRQSSGGLITIVADNEAERGAANGWAAANMFEVN